MSERVYTSICVQALRQMQAAAQRGEVLLQDDAADSSLVSEDMSRADDGETDAGESECSNPERRKLRNRLAQLQCKKEKMENLLGELQTLRQYRKVNGKFLAEWLVADWLIVDLFTADSLIGSLLAGPLLIGSYQCCTFNASSENLLI